METVPVRGRKVQRAETPADAGWSLRVGSVVGIPIRIHFTFVLLLAYFAFRAASIGQSVVGWLVFLVVMFACVALHELGHAVMARGFGVRTLEIVLYPIGGIARLENMPTGVAELLIALAGPAVNLVLAALVFAASLASGLPFLPENGEKILSLRDLPPMVLMGNALLAGFNLIPAFPMDGGRVLRALLSLTMPDDRATSIAAWVGQCFAVLFGAVGLLQGNPFLLFIALFVFLGAGQEASFFRRRAAVLGHEAREAMVVEFDTLAPNDSLEHAAERLLATHQQDFPVVDAWNRVVGVLTRATLLRGLASRRNQGAVLDVMDRNVATVRPDADLEEVLRFVQANPQSPVLVVDESGLRGMITIENLAEFIEVVRHAEAGRRARQAASS